MDPHVPSSSNQTGSPWTDEKHLRFLSLIEASFVRTMLEDNNNNNNNNGRFLRLDRYLPDSSESTLDLKSSHRRTLDLKSSQRRKKHAASSWAGDFVGPRNRRDGGADKRTRRLSSQRHDPSQDQVVPQMGNRNGEKDKRGPA